MFRIAHMCSIPSCGNVPSVVLETGPVSRLILTWTWIQNNSLLIPVPVFMLDFGHITSFCVCGLMGGGGAWWASRVVVAAVFLAAVCLVMRYDSSQSICCSGLLQSVNFFSRIRVTSLKPLHPTELPWSWSRTFLMPTVTWHTVCRFVLLNIACQHSDVASTTPTPPQILRGWFIRDFFKFLYLL